MNQPSANPTIQQYVDYLLADIEEARKNLQWPFSNGTYEVDDWVSMEEESETAPVSELQTWTGIDEAMFPPSDLLSEDQIKAILSATLSLLEACNCTAMFLVSVPERIQYETIRKNFNQRVQLMQWSYGFFEFCKSGTTSRNCVLGEYCHCEIFQEILGEFIDEDLSPEEQRDRDLEIQLSYLKNKYGDRWMKYYPYHLDKNYDDEFGTPFDYLDFPDSDDQ